MKDWVNRFYLTSLWAVVSLVVPLLSFYSFVIWQGRELTVAIAFTVSDSCGFMYKCAYNIDSLALSLPGFDVVFHVSIHECLPLPLADPLDNAQDSRPTQSNTRIWDPTSTNSSFNPTNRKFFRREGRSPLDFFLYSLTGLPESWFQRGCNLLLEYDAE